MQFLLFQYDYLEILYQIIIIASLIVMTVVEVIRLYLGYVGNLTEKVNDRAVIIQLFHLGHTKEIPLS